MCILAAPCAEVNIMEPEYNNAVTVSSNSEDVTNLRSVDTPQWASNPIVEADYLPVITMELSKEHYIKDVFVNGTQNIDFIEVTIFDSQGDEVTAIGFSLKII